MGETATDTRQEIERTRRELGTTLAVLRTRTLVIRGRVVRVAMVAGAALSVVGIGVGTVVLVRSRRGGAITRAATRLPNVTHDVALPIARSSDRWLTRRAGSARRQREQLLEELSARIAENQAQAQRRANPLWRRAASTALETAASVGVAALVRRAMSEPGGGRNDVRVHTATEERDGMASKRPGVEDGATPVAKQRTASSAA
jgi:hypothetical protein